MSSEREAFERVARKFGLSVKRCEHLPTHYEASDTKTAYCIWLEARQDWPSEDEAVEIMKTAMAERQGYKTWHEMEMNEAMNEPEQWIDFAECYRALLAATPAPKGGDNS